MKALSLQQPWAWLIVNGYKDIENRDWFTSFRGPVLIHASKTWDEEAFPLWNRGFTYSKYDKPAIVPANIAELMPLFGKINLGGIVGIAEITACAITHKSPWFVGEYGFVLENARPLPFIPLRGRLGFFDVPDGVVKELAIR